MTVLIVSTSDIQGGAARAAYRLHKALLVENINSQMLVQRKSSDDFTVFGPESKLERVVNKIRPVLDSIPFRLFKNKGSTLFSSSWLPSGRLIKKINALNPDIVHLHWINSGMLKIEDLAKINAPIVWSLHDMWPLNGGWHYDEPLATSYQKKLDNRILKRKKNTYYKINNMTIVALSKWLQICALESGVFKNKRIVNLPNPIDTEIYQPLDKIYSRKLWGMPEDKKIVLFGAVAATSDPRKGFKELTTSLSELERDDVIFVIFGSSIPENPLNLGCQVHYLGPLSDDRCLVTLYSAVDTMVVPSRQEAFGQTASEAMACGTPVVAFGHTGLLDIVDHKKNGYLARPLDISDLARGIEWVLDNESYSDLCLAAREKVVSTFSNQVVAKKYIKLYENILRENA